LGYKAGFGQIKQRAKILSGRIKSVCGVAGNAPVAGQRVRERNRAYAVVFCPATMATLAAEIGA
jgi:hypothetical protein